MTWSELVELLSYPVIPIICSIPPFPVLQVMTVGWLVDVGSVWGCECLYMPVNATMEPSLDCIAWFAFVL